ncbi:MAG: DUF1080 domain-containing protein [Pirellulales bacterium]
MNFTTLIRLVLLLAFAAVCPLAFADEKPEADSDGWIELFNGKDLSGWKVSTDNPDSFQVEDGKLIVKGPRAHLYYAGPIEDADFTNFEWKCEIMTKPKANSGMYFHSEYQAESWPKKGYEVQVNSSHGDPRKTGSLYAIEDVMDNAPSEDNEWFTQHVIVNGKRIIIKVNDKVVVDYTEPEDVERTGNDVGKLIDSGTFAIQAHDPGSEIHYRSIMVKPLP